MHIYTIHSKGGRGKDRGRDKKVVYRDDPYILKVANEIDIRTYIYVIAITWFAK